MTRKRLVEVWHLATPYGPMIVSRGAGGGVMRSHRHVRPHCVFTLRGGYWEGADLASRCYWRAGELALFPPRHRHRTWFGPDETLLASLRLTSRSAARLGLAGLSEPAAARLDPWLCERLCDGLIAAQRDPAESAGHGAIFQLIEAALVGVHGRAPGDHWLEATRRRLDSCFAAPPSLGALAGAVRRNPSYLSHAFHQRFGVTISQYVRRQRVLAAATLLGDPATSVTDAALAAGFADSAHFANAFREHSHVSASQFRRARTMTRSVALTADDPN